MNSGSSMRKWFTNPMLHSVYFNNFLVVHTYSSTRFLLLLTGIEQSTKQMQFLTFSFFFTIIKNNFISQIRGGKASLGTVSHVVQLAIFPHADASLFTVFIIH